MRPFLWLLLLLVAVPAARAQQVEFESAMADVQTLMQAHQRRFDAMTSGDFATLDSLLAPNLIYTHSSGQVDTKDEYLDSQRSGSLRYLSIESSDVDVQVYTDTGVITGQAAVRAAVGGVEQPVMTLRFTEVYVQWEDGGPWQLVVWQSTRLPQ